MWIVALTLVNEPITVISLMSDCSCNNNRFLGHPSWPNQGQLNTIDYVNNKQTVTSGGYTSDGCNMETQDTSLFTGVYHWADSTGRPADNCCVSAPDQHPGQGCSFAGKSVPVGSAFNSVANGGVWAMHWDSKKAISIFYFAQSSLPPGLSTRNASLIDTSEWGLPYARIQLGDICPSSHFTNMGIIIGVNFCGWASSEFTSSCSAASTCNAYVRDNPADFESAYWSFRYIDVYDIVQPPSAAPTPQPTAKPTAFPTLNVTTYPTGSPSCEPTEVPTAKPSQPTHVPTVVPPGVTYQFSHSYAGNTFFDGFDITVQGAAVSGGMF
jgi:hypothetical protein